MFVALDVGGSSIKAGVVDIASNDPAGTTREFSGVGEVTRVPLDHSSDRASLIAAFATAIESTYATLHGHAADGIVIAVPDPFNHAEGISLMEHKFGALYGCRLGDEIDRFLQTSERSISTPISTPISWCNDAAAAVAGEAVAGAGRGVQRVLGVTLGTGFGAAFIVNGEVVEAAGGYVIPNLYEHEAPSGGTADSALSARAYVERSAQGGTPESFGSDLGEFLAPIVTAIDANLVVVGGGGLASFEHFAPAMRNQLDVPVVPA
ncbi:MAG TPA: ROK family protein, partial [Ilumatobacter sp.]|nr:ROK family protein [Ilumatobacter sp.]